MPRYFLHLHAGESRANPDNTGQNLPDPDAAREMARRIARRLLEWNLEPVPWLDYQVQVTDEAGAIVCQLPLTEAVDRTARAEAEVAASLRAQLSGEVAGSPDRNVTPEAEDEGLLERLDAEMSSLVLESRAVTRPRTDVQGEVDRPGTALALPGSLGRKLWGEQASGTQADPSAAERKRSALGDTEAAKRSVWKPFRKARASWPRKSRGP
jgi:hypothetical protein